MPTSPSQVLTLVSLAAMARENGLTMRSARARLARAGVMPHAIVICGPNADPIPVFERSRAESLRDLLTPDPSTSAT